MSDTLKIANSIWLNGMQVDSEGHAVFYPLGTNKIEVPTSYSEWPKGDKLIYPFVYQDDKLVGFVDTKALTTDSQTTIYLPYTHIEVEFSEIDKGQVQIYAPNATIKKASWKNSGVEDIAEVQFKYMGCKTVDNVTTVDANYTTTDIVDGAWTEPLWDLTNGTQMFEKCVNLTSFTSNMPRMTNGSKMFNGCDNLTSFTSDLSSLVNGAWMFANCDNLTSFSSALPKLENGAQMFGWCDNLTSFSSDLPKMTRSNQMFYNCTNLTSFTANMPRMFGGSNMFYGCKLDAASVKNIIDTLNKKSSGQLTLGMGCDDTEEDKNLFAQEAGYADMTSLLAAIKAKISSTTAQYNGRPTTTYGLRRPSENTLPVFVQLEETEDRADYTSEDGSKKYILNYFHETTGSTDGYTQFNSLEEAIETLNIKPIEN